MIEILPIWLDVVDSVSSAKLRSKDFGELAFVPNEALVPGADLIAARRPCVGLPESPKHSSELCKIEWVNATEPPPHSFRDRLEAHELFPKLDPGDAAAQVLGQYGVGPDMAIVVTQACPPSHGFGHARLQRPCLHRVRFHSASNAIDVHTLGPIESYRSLAISTDGTRAAYVAVDPITLDPRPGLFTVAIEQTRLGPIQRIDADIHRDAKVGIGVDGRVVVVESPVQIGDYGSLPTARAFLVPSS